MAAVNILATRPQALRLPGHWLIGGLAGALCGIVLLAVGIGAVAITPAQSLSILAELIGLDVGVPFTEQQQAVLLTIRLPQIGRASCRERV